MITIQQINLWQANIFKALANPHGAISTSHQQPDTVKSVVMIDGIPHFQLPSLVAATQLSDTYLVRTAISTFSYSFLARIDDAHFDFCPFLFFSLQIDIHAVCFSIQHFCFDLTLFFTCDCHAFLFLYSLPCFSQVSSYGAGTDSCLDQPGKQG